MHKRALLTFLVAAAGSVASADDFTWVADTVGTWSNPNNWIGPGVPNSAVDTVAVPGQDSVVFLDMHVSVNELSITGGAEVHNEHGNPYHLWVSEDVLVDGLDSMLHIVPEGPLDLLADHLTLSDWGHLYLEDGYALFNDQVWIGDNGYLKGNGLINMSNGAGDFILASHADVYVGDGASGTLRIDTFGDTARLDWGAPLWKISVWPGQTLEMMLQAKNAMNGTIDISNNAAFHMEHVWIASANSQIEIGGDSSITGGPMDIYGTFRVNGAGAESTVQVPLMAFRSDIELGDPSLNLDGNVILNGAQITAAEGTSGNLLFGANASTLSIQGNTNVITPGIFDLDGANGNLIVTVEEDAGFVLNAAELDTLPNHPFNSELNIEGAAWIVPAIDNEGIIAMAGGEFFGGIVHNNGIVRGRGAITNVIYNNDLLEAIDGTLEISSASILDGAFEIGQVRAVDGDLVLSGGDEDQHFNGDMWVGNGVGIREVFDMDGDLQISRDFGIPGSLTLNGGRVNARSLSLESIFTNEGDSILSTFGQGEIIFRNQSDNTINGVVTLWQDGDIESAASFTGSGTLATFPNRSLNIRNGADTGSVEVFNAGTVTLQGALSGSVNVGAYSQAPTGTFSPTISFGSHDTLVSDTTIQLDGNLHVGVTNGFVPPAGSSYTIMQAEQVTGTFDSVTTAPEIGKAIVDITDTEVIVTVTCAADMNGDGVLNILDFVAFQLKWDAGDPEADCDNNGVFNILDFVCYQTLFQQGC